MAKQIKVTVEGRGTFQVSIDKIGELLAWLSDNQAIDVTENNMVKEVQNNQFTGRVLLNEDTK